MKVLVTGGSGFIGTKLVKALLVAGYEVRLLSRSDIKQSESDNVEIIQCDLLDSSFDLEKVIKDCSVIFNCVGELHNKDLMQKLHVDATKRLIEACKSVARSSATPVHFVQLSSVGVYGPNPSKASDLRVVTEETMHSPVGTYEITKTQADEIIILATESGVFTYTILRPSIVYGKTMPNNSIRQWGKLVEKKVFFYIGKAGTIATYVHVDDVVDALMLCGFDEKAKNNIFNISKDCNLEVVVKAFAEKFQVKEPTIRLPENFLRLIVTIFSGFKKFPLSHSRIDALVSRTSYPTDKISHILGFKPKRNVCKTICEVYDDKLE